MFLKGIIKSGEYFDSITLMLATKSLTEIKGVLEAAVIMGTKENKEILKASKMLLPELESAKDTDLLIVVKMDNEKNINKILKKAEKLLEESKHKKEENIDEYCPKSIEGAVKQIPGVNLAIISVAGKYAGDEAMKALKNGLHVMLFSDNVPIKKEIELKKYAREKELLMMGPDCGTAIINGAPLCFANVVNKGDIGIVAASGTGLQEVSCIISKEGAGISQAIGTGGRDVKKEVGGIMFIEGIKALAEDKETKVIVLVSKPPHKEVLKKIAVIIEKINKPIVAILLGGDSEAIKNAGGIPAKTLEEAALIAVSISKGKNIDDFKKILKENEKEIENLAKEEVKKIKKGQKYIRGLFSGGTLCDESQLLFKEAISDVYSNTPINPDFKLKDVWKSYKHTIIDLGEDEFTVGRLHPMIDFSLRNKRILEEVKDPEVAVILLDLVLGYGSNKNPDKELLPIIKRAHKILEKEERYLPIICSVTGTDKDPQNKKKIEKILKKVGVIIMKSNAAASKLSSNIIKIIGEE